jgi:hypothetical protein
MKVLHRALPLAGCVLATVPAHGDSLQVGYSGDTVGIGQAARIGYSSADGVSGGQLRLGMRYMPDPTRPLPNVQLEPMVALTIADERAKKLDRKEAQAGARLIFGMYGYLDAALAAGVDRRSDAHYDGLRATGMLLPERISGTFAALRDRGWQFRPKGGAYVERMRHSADPEAEPDGRVSGAWLGIDAAWLPATLPRHAAGYRNRFTRDFSASGARQRGTYRFHAVSYTYQFSDPNKQAAGKPTVSLTIERAIGADPVEGTRQRHATTAVYLGFQL